MGSFMKHLVPGSGNILSKIDPGLKLADKVGLPKMPKRSAAAAVVPVAQEDDTGILAARRRRLAGVQGASGRGATIITAGTETKLGG